MESYNYFEVMIQDVLEEIKENRKYWDGFDDMDRTEKENFLTDTLWDADAVTGNASGSYFFCDDEAKKAVVDNIELLIDAIETFGENVGDAIKSGWEYCDVSIRCYLLGQAIFEALNQLEA